MKFAKINLWFGILFFIMFLLSGQYMKHFVMPYFFEEYLLRLQIKASHVYILFVALLNVMSYKCVLSEHKYTYYLNIIFRLLLVAAGVLAVVSFVFEHATTIVPRPFGLYTVVLSLVAIVIVGSNEVLSFVFENRKKII